MSKTPLFVLPDMKRDAVEKFVATGLMMAAMEWPALEEDEQALARMGKMVFDASSAAALKAGFVFSNDPARLEELCLLSFAYGYQRATEQLKGDHETAQVTGDRYRQLSRVDGLRTSLEQVRAMGIVGEAWFLGKSEEAR